MANRFWIGGSGDWSDTAHWSATSGGAGGVSVPTSVDNATFDANSFSANGQAVTGIDTCLTLTATAVNKTGITMSGSIMQLYGSLLLPSSSIVSLTTTTFFWFAATSGSWSIQTGGSEINTLNQSNGVIFSNGVDSSATWTFLDGMTLGIATPGHQGIQIDSGTVNFGSFTHTMGAVSVTSSAATTRPTLNLQTATFNLGTNGYDSDCWNMYQSCTINAGTSTINIIGNGSTVSFRDNNAGHTYATVAFTALPGPGFGQKTITCSNGVTMVNLTMTGHATKYFSSIYITGTVTVTGVCTFTGASSAKKMRVATTANQTGAFNDDGQLVCTGTVAWTDVLFQGILVHGGTNRSGTRVGDLGGNNGITFNTPVNRYWVGNGGSWSDTTHWSTTSGGASGATVPNVQDTAIFDANSFSSTGQTVTVDVLYLGSMDWSAVTKAPTLSISTVSLTDGYGFLSGTSYVMNSTVTMSGNNLVIMSFESGTRVGYPGLTQTVTSNGFLWNGPSYNAISEYGCGLNNWSGSVLDWTGTLIFTDDFLIGTAIGSGNNQGTDFWNTGGGTMQINSGATLACNKIAMECANLIINGTLTTYKVGSYPFDFDWGLARTVSGSGKLVCDAGTSSTESYPSVSTNGFSPALTIPWIYFQGTGSPNWEPLAGTATFTRFEKHPDQTHHLFFQGGTGVGSVIGTLVWDGKKGALCNFYSPGTPGTPGIVPSVAGTQILVTLLNGDQHVSYVRVQDWLVAGGKVIVDNGVNIVNNTNVTFRTPKQQVTTT